MRISVTLSVPAPDQFRTAAPVHAQHALDKRTFVAKVLGRSMEPAIPDGCWALFRLFPGGAAPTTTILGGRRVVVQLREAADPEHGGGYTLKRWHVVKLGSDGGVEEIELRPDNPDFKPMRMRRADGEIRAITEFLEVVG